ncbi:hypothetical protein [Helicobacter sp.]|nr:hypothetical protein [Helicobacter sp.]
MIGAVVRYCNPKRAFFELFCVGFNDTRGHLIFIDERRLFVVE